MTSPTIAPPRTALSRMVGRIVTVEAVWSAVARQLGDGSWLYHCSGVVVYPHGQYDHVWLANMPMKARRALYEGTRFSFRGTVYEYAREDGRAEWGIQYAGGLNVSRG